jgi:hypothetical protein
MSAPDPKAELLKTMKYITEVFPGDEDYERPLTCFLGLLASEEDIIIFSPEVISVNSHQPIIKELLLKINIGELNWRSLEFILAACAIYGYSDIFDQLVPSDYCSLFVAHTLYAFERRKGWGYNSDFILDFIDGPELKLASEDKRDVWMIYHGFVEYFEKLTADKSILPEKRILIAKIAISYARFCKIRWYKYILEVEAEYPGLKVFTHPKIESRFIESIEKDFTSGKSLNLATEFGSLRVVKYFVEETSIGISLYDLAEESIKRWNVDLFKYCLGKIGIDRVSKIHVASFIRACFGYPNSETLKLVLALPNFDAKELANALKEYYNYSKDEILELFLPFFVKFVDERNPDGGTDEDYEYAKYWFGKVLELFLEGSRGSRQIVEDYAHIDYVGEALGRVPADK